MYPLDSTRRWLLAMLVVMLAQTSVWPHPGPTDDRGAHICRDRCTEWGLRDGELHVHATDGRYEAHDGDVYDVDGKRLTVGTEDEGLFDPMPASGRGERAHVMAETEDRGLLRDHGPGRTARTSKRQHEMIPTSPIRRIILPDCRAMLVTQNLLERTVVRLEDGRRYRLAQKDLERKESSCAGS